MTTRLAQARRRPTRAGDVCTILALAGLLATTPAQARPSRAEAEALRIAAQEEHRLAALRVESAAKLRAIEEVSAERAAETATLAARRDATTQRLAARAATFAPMIPVFQRLALYPAETLLAAPLPPEQALRGLAVMRNLVRQLEQEAAALRQEQAALLAQTRELEASVQGLQTVLAQQAEEDRTLEQQLAASRANRLQMDDAARRAEADAARAETLRSALATLEASRARNEAQARADEIRAERQRQDLAAAEARRRQAVAAPAPGPGPEARNQLLAPVAGTVLRSWGAPTDAGPATGVSYRPAPQARVVSPCEGRVRFAGPFRSYGVVVILDCGGGYAFVLAGLARLDVSAGGAALAGEPVGAMPDWNPAGSGPHPALYLELRRDGQAIDPRPFLRTRG